MCSSAKAMSPASSRSRRISSSESKKPGVSAYRASTPAGFAKQLLALTHAHDGRVDSAQHGINTVEAGDVPLLLLAREELTDLAPDHVHSPQETILRLPDFAAVESQHADRLAFGAHRKNESAVHALVTGKLSLYDAGVAGDVGGPERLSRLPRHARQSDALRVDDVARFLNKPLDVGTGGAPGFAEPQHPGLFVRAK